MNMKHGLYLFMFLLCGTGLQAQDRVVEQPAFDAWSSTTLEIDKIALSDTATVFYIDAYFRPKYWIQVVKETTLRADGKTYPIKTGDGITLSKKFWMPESGEASFRLIFPPLPKGTKTVDFIEGDEEGAFKIWGIHLDGSSTGSSFGFFFSGREKEPEGRSCTGKAGVQKWFGNPERAYCRLQT